MEPYVGLGHFTEDFADRFFGRDTECSLIIGNLRAARLTLLYAESGVGKSSLLRAGVVARLHGFAEHDVEVRGRPRLVPVVFSSWSEAPVAGLVRVVAEAVRPYLDEGVELDLPEDDLERALELASVALEATLLVILDQFEEYFLYPELGPEEEHVAAQIARCVNRRDLRANFLISIREDSYSRLGDLFRGKLTNVYANFLHLDFLGRDGARESIEKPIERVSELGANGHQYELEPALVEAVLDQVGRGRIEAADEDGQLGGDDEIETTYLQLVMRRLWEEETGAGSDRLRLATLEQLGGSQAVITSHLDRAMDDETEGASLSAEQRFVAASIFHFLVTSGGTKIALTVQDLADLSGRPRAEVEPVLRHLSSPALHILRPVVSENGQGEPRFEIFHDALARPIVEWRTRVEETERDARLKRERAEKERAQQAAAEAEAREERERRRKRLALALAGAAVLLAVIAVVVALIRQQGVSDEREARNQSVEAAARMDELSESPTFGQVAAALASVEDYRLSPTDQARNIALSVLQLNPGLPTLAVGHTRPVNTVAYWPDSSGFVTGGQDGTVRLWRPDGSEIGSPLVNPGSGVASVALTELRGGRKLIAAGLTTGLVELYEVEDSGKVRLPRPLFREPGAVEALAFDRAGAGALVVGGPSGRVSLWDLSKPSAPDPVFSKQAPGGVADLAAAPGGDGVLVSSAKAGQIWREAGSSGVVQARTLVPGPTTATAAGPNGSFAFGTRRGVFFSSGARADVRYLRVPGGVSSLAFGRGGSVLVAGGGDCNVVTWDVASGRSFGPPRPGGGDIEDVAISPGGETIAAAGQDSLVRLWPLWGNDGLAETVASLSPREIGSQISEIADLDVSADGLLATAGGPAGASLWRLGQTAGAQPVPRPLARIPGATWAVAFHGDLLAVARGRSFVLEDTGPSCATMPAEPCQVAVPARPHSQLPPESLAFKRIGSRLVLASTGFRDGEGLINLWNVTGAERRGAISHLTTLRKPTRIYKLALSPAEPLLVAATEDGKLRVWDIHDPEKPEGIDIAHARGNEDQPVSAVAFSDDGSLLASGGGDQQVVLWSIVPRDSGPPKVVATPGTLYLTQTVFSLAFSPAGEYLAVGDGNGLTCIYAVKTRRKIGTCLIGHVAGGEVGVKAVSFARVPGHGTSLLTAGSGNPAVAWSPILWNMSDQDGIEEAIADDACELAHRNLTLYEWNAVFADTNLDEDRQKTCSRFELTRGE